MATESTDAAGRKTSTRCVAVFGSSEAAEGSSVYDLARDLGGRLARAGYTVITGGYGGVMEAASRGAVEAGGDTIGVTTRAFAPRRPTPNRFITQNADTDDLHDRTRELIERSSGYIILPGRAGTLAELTFLWALNRAQLLGNRPIVLLGDVWSRFLQSIEGLDLVDRNELSATYLALTTGEAVERIRGLVR